MKKIILSLILLVSTAFSTPAQAFGFDWGLTAGYSLSKLKLKGDMKKNFSADNQSGWYAGLKANVSIALGFGIDASLLYSQEKYSLKAHEGIIEDWDIAESSSKTARFISIPINLRYNIGLGKIASVFLATGPQFDFAIGPKNWDITRNDYEGFKTEDQTISWNVGCGVKVMSKVEVNLGYNFGLGEVGENVLSNLTGSNVKGNDLKNNSFKIGVAYYF